MPSNSMTGDFIQNMLALLQLRQQREQFIGQQQISQQAQHTNLLQTLSGITAGMPDRAVAQQFLESQGQANGLDLPSLLALATGQAPTETAIRSGAIQAGRQALTPEQLAGQNAEAASSSITGMNQSQSGLSQFLTQALGQGMGPDMGQAAVTRLLTGMSPGQMTLDRGVAQLGPDETRQAAQIAQGLSLSAPQQASNALQAQGQNLSYAASMASNRLGWASLVQQGELGHLNLEMEALRSRGAGGIHPNDIPELVKTQQSLTDALSKSSTPAGRQMYLNSLGTINSLLNSVGVPTPQVNPTQDVNQFTPFSLVSPMQTWQPGGRTTLPMFTPTGQR